MKLGKTSRDAAKFNESKVSALWLSALAMKVNLRSPSRTRRPTQAPRGLGPPPRPRTPDARRTRSRDRATRSERDGRGASSASGKGKGGGRGSDKPPGSNPVHEKTRDGRAICSSYNAGNCSSDSCPRKH
eukprot:1671377-Heterocapsa_arctica.AAC.1